MWPLLALVAKRPEQLKWCDVEGGC
jgi:hypothetical protein